MAAPSTLINLGPESDRRLREVGIETVDELRRVGASMAYKILSHHEGRPAHLLFLYALHGALEGRNLNSYSPEEKARFQAEVAADLDVR